MFTMSRLFVLLLVALLSAVHVCEGATDYSKYNARVGKKFMEEKAAEDDVSCTDSVRCYTLRTNVAISIHERSKGRGLTL